MVVNVADAKAKFSSLLSFVGLEEDEVIISKRDKPMAVLISYESFLKMKKQTSKTVEKEDIDALPSTLDKYMGIVAEDELDYGYKKSREAYLQEKYL